MGFLAISFIFGNPKEVLYVNIVNMSPASCSHVPKTPIKLNLHFAQLRTPSVLIFPDKWISQKSLEKMVVKYAKKIDTYLQEE